MHALEPDADEYDPTKHCMHAVDPLLEDEPIGHNTQDAIVADATNPILELYKLLK